MSRPEAAAAIKTSKSRLAAIEVGRNVVSYSELIVLLRDHYHAEEQLAVLEEVREEASQRGWWSTYGLPEGLSSYVGLESDASSLRRLDLENIPGLLQTEAYMRTQCTIDTRLSDREMERRVASRLRRQERLTGPNPLQLTAVVSEGALLRCAGDGRLAAGQLARLIEAAGRPNIELRVLPFGFGLHVGMAGPFALLTFPNDLLPDIAHQEYVVGGHLIDDASVVSQLTTVFSELRSQALGPNESLAMITQLAEHQRE